MISHRISLVNGEKPMSVKKLSGQKSLLETGLYLGDLMSGEKGAERFLLFREKIWPELRRLGPKLAEMYCEDNGRPAVNPVRLLGVSLLQFMEKLPDRHAAEAAKFDVRWKTALEMDLDEGGFDPTVLVRFRDRLLAHGLEGVAFEAVLEILRKEGYLRKKTPRRVDSTHVLGQISKRLLGRNRSLQYATHPRTISPVPPQSTNFNLRGRPARLTC